MNNHWSNREGNTDPWMRSDFLRTVFNVCKVGYVLLAILSIIAVTLYLRQASRTPPIIVEAGDGKVYRGPVQPYRMTEELFKSESSAILKALFLLTEKGALPGLDDCIHPGVQKKFQDAFKGEIADEKAGYYQELRIAEVRLQLSGPYFVNAAYHGFVVSRDQEHYKKNEIFIESQFRVEHRSEKNPLGLVLYGIVKSTRNVFFDKEVKEIKRKALGDAEVPETPTGKSLPNQETPPAKGQPK